MRGVNGDMRMDLKDIRPWGRCWEPRTKVITAFIFVFGVVSLNNPWLVLAAFLFVLAASIMMGLNGRLFSRLVLLIPFLLLMTLPLILGGGLPPSSDRVAFAALIALKALTSMAAMVVMLATQPLEEFMEGLASMKIPPVIISVLFLACRYALLFLEDVKKTRRALISRLFSPGLKSQSLQVYGELAGGMFIKSFDRSDSVYRAMASRGFTGKLPTGLPREITPKDLLISLVAVSFILFLIVAERVVII
ncbi:MAG: cobalt ECF transporter T component CbiQ [Candidatus Syntrophonatronum acetioxidans]|uniref:Cobalt ECF transporter T component CbiQ n=1 Tax=Candidatus Syntrophonatronum acetioxidans TaxID=1795816 RepID=A0A424YGP7_9FIRM|nr:MAG: cobalt ECF transporter T component CbiQ [Candidatus Syntrophonatronum acetioxidans]